MEQKQKTIKLTDNVTTRDALSVIAKHMAIVFRNTWRCLDNAVHKLPWVFIVLTIIIAATMSFLYIGKARAERDSYSIENLRLTMELNEYKTSHNGIR